MLITEKIKCNFTSVREFWLFTRIFFLATLLPPMLKYLPLSMSLRLLTPNNCKKVTDFERDYLKEKIIKYTEFILSWNFLVWKKICLRQALVLFHFFYQIGLDIQIFFGVRENPNLSGKAAKKMLQGHAWLVSNGKIYLEINDDYINTYAVTYRFPFDENMLITK